MEHKYSDSTSKWETLFFTLSCGDNTRFKARNLLWSINIEVKQRWCRVLGEKTNWKSKTLVKYFFELLLLLNYLEKYIYYYVKVNNVLLHLLEVFFYLNLFSQYIHSFIHSITDQNLLFIWWMYGIVKLIYFYNQ